jgi:hypothetical protein
VLWAATLRTYGPKQLCKARSYRSCSRCHCTKWFNTLSTLEKKEKKLQAGTNAQLMVVMMLAGVVDVTKRIPNCVRGRSMVGKLVAEMAVHIDQKGGHLEGE